MRVAWQIGVAGLGIAMMASAAAAADGVYAARCAMCHQSAGKGLPGQFPHLAGRVGAIASSREGRAYLVQVVSNGLSGPIQIDGQAYAGLMPPQAGLKDQEIADTLTYLSRLPAPRKGVAAFTAAEVAAVRSGGRKSLTEMRALREALVAAGQLR